MKNENSDINTEVDESHYEDWEFDYTNNVVEEFLETEVLPKLTEFDYDNSDENYIPGVACFTLYTRLVEMLIDDGWSVEELKRVIDEFGNIPDGLLH